MDSGETPLRSIRMIIESRLENVVLIGMTVNRMCSLIPLSEADAFKMELCAVEAVNNSILHAYGSQAGFEIETRLVLYPGRLMIQVLDTGHPMDPRLFREKIPACSDYPSPEICGLPESGRGIGIIKSIMDHVSYGRQQQKNCLTMIKNFHLNGNGVSSERSPR